MEFAMNSRLAEAIAPTLLAILMLAIIFTPVQTNENKAASLFMSILLIVIPLLLSDEVIAYMRKKLKFLFFPPPLLLLLAPYLLIALMELYTRVSLM